MMMLFLKATPAEDSWPKVGDKVSFMSDLHTDKGPSSGKVTDAKITVDGLYLRIKHSDAEQLFSWDDIKPGARKTSHGWLIKARPTEAQAEAGNYKMKRRSFRGLEISVENPAGSVREGADRGGKKWRTKMAFDYGYIRLTKGVDGDHVDCYVGPDEDAPNVYVVTQMAVPDFKKVDEQKAMLGFKTKQAAVRAYLSHYDDKRFLGEVTVMPFDEFKDKVLATKDKPGMVKAALIFLKAHVRGHTRRLRSGKVVTVAPFERRGNSASPKAPAAHVPQTETPEFKRWFGGSKVVDRKGNPLVVYHGSKADISEFRPGKDGGIYMTSSEDDADKFSGFYGGSIEGAPNITPVYLSMRNPLIVDAEGEEFEPSMTDGYIAEARENGNDGVIVRDIRNFEGGGTTDTYIVFRPEQVKSAIGNSGNFSVGDPDITKSAPMVVFVKSYVRAHVRRTKDGKVISVGSYHNSVVPEPAPLRGRGKDTLTGDLFGAQPSKAVEGKKQSVTEPTDELIDEHRRLVRVLESPSHADDKAEAAKQREELRGYEGQAPAAKKSAAKDRESSTKTIDVPAPGRKWISGALVRDRATNALYRVTGKPARYHDDAPPVQRVTKVRDLPPEWRSAIRMLEIMGKVRSTGMHTPSSRGAYGLPSDRIRDMPDTAGDSVEWVARQDEKSYASYPFIEVHGDLLRVVEPIYDDSPIVVWLRDAALADEARSLIAAKPSLTRYPSVSVRG